MTNVIHMTALQAKAVEGPSLTDPHQVLAPALLSDGTYTLGAQNIANPAFADRRALLQSYPQVDLDTVIAPKQFTNASTAVDIANAQALAAAAVSADTQTMLHSLSAANFP